MYEIPSPPPWRAGYWKVIWAQLFFLFFAAFAELPELQDIIMTNYVYWKEENAKEEDALKEEEGEEEKS